MSNSILNFKNGFRGGSRPNRFEVFPSWPSRISVNNRESKFKIVSSSLPGAQINTIGIPYRGRTVTFAGDRSYTPWLVGVYDDNNVNNLWKAFNQWKEAMDGHVTHRVENNDFAYNLYQTNWRVNQLDLNGTVLRTIQLFKCWPNVVGQIDLSMGETNFVSFNVSLTFDYMKVTKGLRSGGSL